MPIIAMTPPLLFSPTPPTHPPTQETGQRDRRERERKEEGRLCRDIFSDMHKFPDQHVTSPDSDTTEPFVKIMRITEMIANARSSDCSTISPCQYQGKFIAKIMENLNTDVWVLRVNDQVSLHRHFSLA